MSTNQDRRAEARQRLREQMEAQARREKQLRIVAASVVAILVLGLVGFVVWKKYDEKKAQEYADTWASCEYPETEPREKYEPPEGEELGEEELAEIEAFNDMIERAEKEKRDAEPPTGDQPKRGTTHIMLATNMGDIPVSLDHGKAPCNVASFVGLVEQEFFDDTPCHRLAVAKEDAPEQGLSLLQCGDPTGTGISGPGYSIVDEKPTDLPASEDGMSVVYPRGTVAMAKSQQPDSAGSQFFLVYDDSPLPAEYSVVGAIEESGLDVLDKISKVGIISDDQFDEDFERPKKDITIEKAKLEGQEDLPQK